jgi:aryl-alcohol dehydrogenase-like predicted oxidoreductase
LFGATKPEQVADNVGALEVIARLSPEDRTELASIG